MAQEETENLAPELLRTVANQGGYAQLLGMQIEVAEIGQGRVSIDVDQRLMHPQQIVHGGVIFTLADTAMAMALVPAYPLGTRVGTIEAKINYLQPVTTGRLVAEARIVHQGRSTVVMEATVYNSIAEAEPSAIARVLGTFNIGRPRPAGEGEGQK